jgi:hypothetical protein
MSGSGFINAVSYKKTDYNEGNQFHISWRGVVQKTSGNFSSGNVLFTTSGDQVPNRHIQLVCAGGNSVSNTYNSCIVHLENNGQVVFKAGLNNNQTMNYLSLEGVSYWKAL